MILLNEKAVAELADADKAVKVPRVSIFRCEAWIDGAQVFQEEAQDRDSLAVFKGRLASAERLVARASR
ncbi:hypothetical protein DHOM_02750 [Dermabacter hominis 1368]|uniref:Uncharacterized protein n=1 Tax=Dermabacter hominis 1368 TaxID=1450519 RepID=A0ABR4SLU5_9MICO|nr:hypothetical protein DHOM_02750 [Dermabacter hominis 1368]